MVNLKELGVLELSSDPPNPANGSTVIWMSDGTGTGNAGDVILKTTNAIGTTKTINLTDFTNGQLAAPLKSAGTPADDQVAVWTASDTVEGDSNLVWDGSTLTATGTVNATTALQLGGTGVLTDGGVDHTSPGFDTWTQISATRPGIVIVSATSDGSVGSNAQVNIQVDDSGENGPADRTYAVSFAAAGLGANPPGTAMAYVPAGGQFQIQNAADPNTGNTINSVDKITL